MFFLPYRIDRPFRLPVVTVGLMVACVIAFFATIFDFETAVRLLAFRMNVFAPVTWFTSMFLHAGLMHLLGNLYFLWLFGSVVEDAVGRLRFLALYCAGGFFAVLAHTLVMHAFMPDVAGVPLVGASGAIAGVIGVAAVRLSRERMAIFWMIFMRWGTFYVSAAVGVGLYLARELFSAFLAFGAAGAGGGVANWAHIGGVVFGAVASLVFGLGKEEQAEVLTREAASYSAAGMADAAASRYAKAAALGVPDGGEAGRAAVRESLIAASLSPDPTSKPRAAEQARRHLLGMLRSGDRAGAAEAYGEFVRLTASGFGLDAASLLALGMASEARRDPTAASVAYYEAFSKHRGTPEAEKALFRLAHAYLDEGRPADARAAWDAFRRLHPRSQWLPFASDALTSAG